MRKATIATAMVTIKVITMAVKIFGAADGLRPKAPMLACPVAANTSAGTRMHKANISVNAMFLGKSIHHPT